jgi:hypothetical protein
LAHRAGAQRPQTHQRVPKITAQGNSLPRRIDFGPSLLAEYLAAFDLKPFTDEFYVVGPSRPIVLLERATMGQPAAGVHCGGGRGRDASGAAGSSIRVNARRRSGGGETKYHRLCTCIHVQRRDATTVLQCRNFAGDGGDDD